ncbi:Protein CBG07817 [Caenorhabditis briggsae]|uniref:Protein CBG07817 n=1 Tax=Caenorhabditis briggsae TaxID=6238 RepID=A8X578_CAEBR|nr:Protein CBG07817 [Caenorhabditis briggsae]CAP27777.2 Protein CBG07817 [Caenorhabditis briggsae]
MPAENLLKEFFMDSDPNGSPTQNSDAGYAPTSTTSQIWDINQSWTGTPLPSISIFSSSPNMSNALNHLMAQMPEPLLTVSGEFFDPISIQQNHGTSSGFWDSNQFQEPVVQNWEDFGDPDFSYQLGNVQSVGAFEVPDDVTSDSPNSGSINDNLSLLDPTPMSTEQEFPGKQNLFSASTPIYKESLISNSSDPEPMYSEGPFPVSSQIQEPENSPEVKRPKKRCLTPIYSLILGPTPDVQNMTELVSYRSFRTKYHAHMKIAPPVKIGSQEYDQRYKEACKRAENSPVYHDEKIVCLSCLFDPTSPEPIPQEVVNPVDAAMCYKLWRVNNYSSMWCANLSTLSPGHLAPSLDPLEILKRLSPNKIVPKKEEKYLPPGKPSMYPPTSKFPSYYYSSKHWAGLLAPAEKAMSFLGQPENQTSTDLTLSLHDRMLPPDVSQRKCKRISPNLVFQLELKRAKQKEAIVRNRLMQGVPPGTFKDAYDHY